MSHLLEIRYTLFWLDFDHDGLFLSLRTSPRAFLCANANSFLASCFWAAALKLARHLAHVESSRGKFLAPGKYFLSVCHTVEETNRRLLSTGVRSPEKEQILVHIEWFGYARAKHRKCCHRSFKEFFEVMRYFR